MLRVIQLDLLCISYRIAFVLCADTLTEESEIIFFVYTLSFKQIFTIILLNVCLNRLRAQTKLNENYCE